MAIQPFELDQDELRRQALMDQLGGGEMPQAGQAMPRPGAQSYGLDNLPQADRQLMAPPEIAPRGPQIDRMGQGPDLVNQPEAPVLPRRGQDSTMPVPDQSQGGMPDYSSMGRSENWRTGFGAPEGYDPNKWGNQMSMKYVASEILSRYAGPDGRLTRQSVEQAMQDPDWQQFFPNATYEGGDKINFGGTLSDFTKGVPVNEVDVIRAFTDDGSGELQWIDIDAAMREGGGGGSGGGPAAPTSIDQLGNNDALAQIIAQINALMGGGGEGESPAYRQALLQMLQGGQ